MPYNLSNLIQLKKRFLDHEHSLTLYYVDHQINLLIYYNIFNIIKLIRVFV